MANYKNIVDVETLNQTSEATNVLVEEAGSLRKIPSSKIGGGNSKTIVFNHYDTWSNDSNVTYEEFEELYNNNGFETIIVKEYSEDDDSYEFYYCGSIYHMSEGGYCLGFRNWGYEMIFYPDGTIEVGGNG